MVKAQTFQWAMTSIFLPKVFFFHPEPWGFPQHTCVLDWPLQAPHAELIKFIQRKVSGQNKQLCGYIGIENIHLRNHFFSEMVCQHFLN